jgi:hypothetical protein
VITSSGNVAKLAGIDPPPHAAYLRSAGSTTLIFIVGGVSATIPFSRRSGRAAAPPRGSRCSAHAVPHHRHSLTLGPQPRNAQRAGGGLRPRPRPSSLIIAPRGRLRAVDPARPRSSHGNTINAPIAAATVGPRASRTAPRASILEPLAVRATSAPRHCRRGESEIAIMRSESGIEVAASVRITSAHSPISRPAKPAPRRPPHMDLIKAAYPSKEAADT